jgi:hypothetical protein
MGLDLDRLRLPLGSIVVDTGLVIALVITNAQLVERMKAFDDRLVLVEKTAVTITPQANARISVIERENAIQDRDLDQFRQEVTHKLEVQDQKLDRILTTLQRQR